MAKVLLGRRNAGSIKPVERSLRRSWDRSIPKWPYSWKLRRPAAPDWTGKARRPNWKLAL